VNEDSDRDGQITVDPNGAQWFREQIALLFGDGGQSKLARLMVELGDDRVPRNVLRSIQRMAAGDHRISGEMRALIGMLNRASQVQYSLMPTAAPHGRRAANPGLAQGFAASPRRQRQTPEHTTTL
jgi:hypothetical protein